MITKATAAHSPDFPSTGPRCWAKRSFRLTASLATVVEYSITNESSPMAAAIEAARSRVASASARPAANPAGIQATAIRSSGCAPRYASSSSGSAPRMCGPTASSFVSRRRYSQPTPAHTATTASAQPRDHSAIRRGP